MFLVNFTCKLLVDAIIRHQKLILKHRELPTVALS